VLLASAFAAGLDKTSGQGYVDPAGSQIELRVIAQPHADGRVEFGIAYGDRQLLPNGRFLTPALIETRRDQWLRSTAVEIITESLPPPLLVTATGETPSSGDAETSAAGTDGEMASGTNNEPADLWQTPGFGSHVLEAYVLARPLSDGRIEFALELEGEHYDPEQRYLTPALMIERAGSWLRSSALSFDLPPTVADILRAVSVYAFRVGSTDGEVASECALRAVFPPDPENTRIFHPWEYVSGGLFGQIFHHPAEQRYVFLVDMGRRPGRSGPFYAAEFDCREQETAPTEGAGENLTVG